MNNYPGAMIVPGPAAMAYPDVNRNVGIVEHSAEGDWSATYTPLDTMRERGVSWHFSVMTDGAVQQHYPLVASCWHAGSKMANIRLIGVEHEGAGRLTEAQIVASVALTRWIAEQGGYALSRTGNVTLYEHRELYETDCPNGRIPWDRYEEDDMEVTKLDQVEGVHALLRVVGGFSGALAQQDGQYIGEASGAPAGYRDVVFRVKEG